MQPEESSLVPRSPSSIDDLLPTLTSLILGAVIGGGACYSRLLVPSTQPSLGRDPVAGSLVRCPLLCSGSGRRCAGRLERTSGPLLERLGHAGDGAREEHLAFASLPQAVGQQ
jgi:hypothetical protein